MTRASLLVGDLGGTNARFALARADRAGYQHERVVRCSDFDSPETAIEDYLRQSGAAPPAALCLAVAAPITGGSARFLNSPWRLDMERLESRFPGARIRLVNDFQAVAHAIPSLPPEDVIPIGPDGPPLEPDRDYTVGVLGPGTGLGVSGLLRVGGMMHALSCEGGHLGFAPETSLQLRVLEHLRDRFARVSDERLLSGPGLENIYRALQKIHGLADDWPEACPGAAAIFQRAQAGDDPVAVEAEALFFEVLGQVAGNLALTLGARDGVYIAGGIVPRYAERLPASPFRAGFENKGRHRGLMERIPTRLVMHPQPGLLGASILVRGEPSA